MRQKIERSISLLKRRWRRLQYLDLLVVKLAVQLVIAGCVLHIVCLLHDDFQDGYFLPGGDDDDDDYRGNDGNGQGPAPPDNDAKQKRVQLMNTVTAHK